MREVRFSIDTLLYMYILFIQNTGNDGAVYLQRTLGAKFLTTEATDALLSVDLRFPFFHSDGFRRAELLTAAATDTALPVL